MKKILIIAFLLLTGCATTNVKDLQLANRSVKFSILNIISFEKSTEGLKVGEAVIVDEDQ